MNETRKNTGLKIVVAILAIGLLACFIWINTLTSEINRLSDSLHSQHQILMGQVESIYNNVENMLQEEASLLSNVTAEHGELNVDDHTIDVTVSLVPKLISDDMKVQLSINGRTTELSRNGSTFTGMIPVNIYNKDEQLLILVIDIDGNHAGKGASVSGKLRGAAIDGELHLHIIGNEFRYKGNGHINGVVVHIQFAMLRSDVGEQACFFLKHVLYIVVDGLDLAHQNLVLTMQ